MKLVATLERESSAPVELDQDFEHDHHDGLWDVHGLLVSVALVCALAAISVVAIFFLNQSTPSKPAATSAMLMIADPADPAMVSPPSGGPGK